MAWRQTGAKPLSKPMTSQEQAFYFPEWEEDQTDILRTIIYENRLLVIGSMGGCLACVAIFFLVYAWTCFSFM